jgi:hypothetical protein
MQQVRRLYHLTLMEDLNANIDRREEKLSKKEVQPEIFPRITENGRDRNESHEEGRTQKRAQREESHESQTGHRDWIVRGQKGRHEGAAAKIVRVP